MHLKTLLATLPLAAMSVAGISCQQRPYPVYFHTQAGGVEEGARNVFMHKGTVYSRMPQITHNHISKFRSFLAEDGSYGVEFFLKPDYRLRLEHLSIEHSGQKLLPVINGLVFEPQRLDRPILDGELVIWSGLNGYDLKQISRTIDPVDEEIEKKRYKSKNPRPLPKIPKEQNQVKDPVGRVIGELYQQD